MSHPSIKLSDLYAALEAAQVEEHAPVVASIIAADGQPQVFHILQVTIIPATIWHEGETGVGEGGPMVVLELDNGLGPIPDLGDEDAHP